MKSSTDKVGGGGGGGQNHTVCFKGDHVSAQLSQ